MKNRVIDLKSLLNMRTLGGLPSTLGGTVRDGILYRSAAWDKLTLRDGVLLRKKYGITLDIDLRTDVEVESAPDKPVKGVTYLRLPVSKNSIPGVSREVEPGKAVTADMLPEMEVVYRGLVATPEFMESFSTILHTIMNHRNGAVLWHCTAGKDRCGLTAFFISSLLGVSREECVKDYMLTNRAFVPEAARYFLMILLGKRDFKLAKKVFEVYIVRKSYLQAALDVIDNQFGGVEEYMRNQLHITDEERDTFRRYALEGAE